MTDTAVSETDWDGDNAFEEADGLLGPSIPAVSFPEIGTKVDGTVIDVNVQNQRDAETGKVKTWDDGSIRRQVVLTIAVKPTGEEDDGRRRLFIKGPSMPSAFKEALAKAKVPGARPGGRVVVTYTGDGTPARKGLNAPKQFSVQYTPPKS